MPAEGIARQLVLGGFLGEEPAPPLVAEVLEGLEAIRRHARTDMLDIPTARYVALERGQGALVV